MTRIVLQLLTVLVLMWATTQYWPVTVYISGATAEDALTIRMSRKDKQRLDFFFRDACFLNMWAYTLFGNKPMSTHQYTHPWTAFRQVGRHIWNAFCNHRNPPTIQQICYLCNPAQLKIARGLHTFYQYLDRLQHPKFTVFEYVVSDDIVCFALVNKPRLVDVVKQHLHDFHEALQRQGIEPDALYHDQNLIPFLKSLKSHSELGIVLGFGQENAQLYERYAAIDPKDTPLVSMWQEEEDAWLERISAKDLSFQPWDASDLFYPPFACLPYSAESQQLKQTYRQDREKILRYYEGKDVVEATLSLLIEK